MGWVDEAFHALTSSRHSPSNIATPQTNADSRHDEHHQICRFGDGGICTGTGAAAVGLAEVGPPDVVVARVDRAAPVAVRL